MKIVNLTPHIVSIVKNEGEVINLMPSGQVARVVSKKLRDSEIDGIKIVTVKDVSVVGLPEIEEGVLLLVSRRVFDKFPLRRDLVAVGKELSKDRNVYKKENLLMHGSD